MSGKIEYYMNAKEKKLIYDRQLVAIVPCYKANLSTLKFLVDDLTHEVDHIVIVDDACPNKAGSYIENKFENQSIHIVWNDINLGVGGATKEGFKYALNHLDANIFIKIDCDGQMLPKDIHRLVASVISGQSHIAKANRYFGFEEILKIPKIRLVGNLVLSFFSKASTGYWELFDPNNGFFAINRSALQRIPLEKISNDYFFESDFLFRSALEQLIITEVKISPIYNQEISSLNPIKQIPLFFKRHCVNTAKRIIYQYFLFDFNPGSLELLICLATFVFSLVWSIYLLIYGYASDTNASSGDTALFILSSLFSMQSFLAFLNYDSTQRALIRTNAHKINEG